MKSPLTVDLSSAVPPPSRFLLWLDGTDECVRLRMLDQTGLAGHPDATARTLSPRGRKPTGPLR